MLAAHANGALCAALSKEDVEFRQPLQRKVYCQLSDLEYVAPGMGTMETSGATPGFDFAVARRTEPDAVSPFGQPTRRSLPIMDGPRFPAAQPTFAGAFWLRRVSLDDEEI